MKAAIFFVAFLVDVFVVAGLLCLRARVHARRLNRWIQSRGIQGAAVSAEGAMLSFTVASKNTAHSANREGVAEIKRIVERSAAHPSTSEEAS